MRTRRSRIRSTYMSAAGYGCAGTCSGMSQEKLGENSESHSSRSRNTRRARTGSARADCRQISNISRAGFLLLRGCAGPTDWRTGRLRRKAVRSTMVVDFLSQLRGPATQPRLRQDQRPQGAPQDHRPGEGARRGRADEARDAAAFVHPVDEPACRCRLRRLRRAIAAFAGLTITAALHESSRRSVEPRRLFQEGTPVARQDYLFTSESVSEGHPDKVCDRISDEIVDLVYREAKKTGMDPWDVRVACETLATTNRVVIAGEVRVPQTLLKKDKDGKPLMDASGHPVINPSKFSPPPARRSGPSATSRTASTGRPPRSTCCCTPSRPTSPRASTTPPTSRARKARATRASCSAMPAARRRT